ncbi:hypothetical protein BGCPKDLD_0125 [Methylorubrum suomiense]|uniref:Acyltransferase 3 domain-containing protein n=2 Tax=Methylorubrum suomiense TaxID=144191 RepID=A0ABQ4UML8_9HYPH|nr:hypothetical protein BGCPKDLD_0125 [Methylorubrum suomiense]
MVMPLSATLPAGRASEGSAEPLMGLDLLRFAAAGLVMAFHLACTAWLVPSSEAAELLGRPMAYPWLLPVSAIGWIGVPIFFVISGTVIAYSASRAGASAFLLNRFLRLMPGIWICATVTFMLALAFAPDAPMVLIERYLRTLVLFPVPRWIDGVYWTLGIEVAFYGLVAALLMLGRRDQIERVILAVGLVSAAAWCLAASPLWPGLDRLISTRIAKLTLITHGCDFAIGVLMWCGMRQGWTIPRLVGLTACLLGALLQIRYDAFTVATLLGVSPSVGAATAIFLGSLILCQVSGAVNAPLIARFPGLAPRLRRLGLATYPLYLLHTVVGVLTMRLMAGLGLSAPVCLAAGVTAAILIALLVSEHVEPPLRRRMRLALASAQEGAAQMVALRRRRSA